MTLPHDPAPLTARGPVCTGVAASWCPRCGDCACPRDEEGWLSDSTGMNHPDCPLHAPGSQHAEKGWLILCHEHGDGSMCLWWRPDGAGYTTDVDDAGRYTEAEARAIEDNRGSDVAVKASLVESLVRRVLPLDRLPGAKSAWRKRHRPAVLGEEAL